MYISLHNYGIANRSYSTGLGLSNHTKQVDSSLFKNQALI